MFIKSFNVIFNKSDHNPKTPSIKKSCVEVGGNSRLAYNIK